MSKPRSNLSTGLWWGSRYAMAYAVVGTIIAIVNPDALKAYGMTLLQLIGLYVASGLVGGAMFGLLLPLVQGQLSAAVVGFLVALPLMFMFGMAMYPEEVGSSLSIWTAVLSAFALGPICGALMWRSNWHR